MKKRNERRRLQYYGTCNPAFRPTPDSKHHLSSKCSFTDGIKWHPHTIACPPKPRPAHSYANSLLTFETPAPALEPSIPPTLPLVRVDDCDPEPQNRDKRPRLTLDTTPQSGNNLVLPSSNPTTPRPFFAEVLDPPKLEWSDELQEQFRWELCMLLVATNTAWWAVDHPYVRWWFSRWVTGSLVPSSFGCCVG